MGRGRAPVGTTGTGALATAASLRGAAYPTICGSVRAGRGSALRDRGVASGRRRGDICAADDSGVGFAILAFLRIRISEENPFKLIKMMMA